MLWFILSMIKSIKILEEKQPLTEKKHGYIQETFANALGVSYSYVAQIEAPNQAKRMSLELLFEIAELLDIDVKDLL